MIRPNHASTARMTMNVKRDVIRELALTEWHEAMYAHSRLPGSADADWHLRKAQFLATLAITAPEE